MRYRSTRSASLSASPLGVAARDADEHQQAAADLRDHFARDRDVRLANPLNQRYQLFSATF